MTELLTDAEHALLGMLASAMEVYARDVVVGGRTYERDVAEFAVALHVLQNMVLAQAAARAYPRRYRLAGLSVVDRTDGV
jgi:hypothetical protein